MDITLWNIWGRCLALRLRPFARRHVGGLYPGAAWRRCDHRERKHSRHFGQTDDRLPLVATSCWSFILRTTPCSPIVPSARLLLSLTQLRWLDDFVDKTRRTDEITNKHDPNLILRGQKHCHAACPTSSVSLWKTCQGCSSPVSVDTSQPSSLLCVWTSVWRWHAISNWIYCTFIVVHVEDVS